MNSAWCLTTTGTSRLYFLAAVGLVHNVMKIGLFVIGIYFTT